MRNESSLRGLVAEALRALVRSSAEKESLRGMGEVRVGRGIVSVILSLDFLMVDVLLVGGGMVGGGLIVDGKMCWLSTVRFVGCRRRVRSSGLPCCS